MEYYRSDEVESLVIANPHTENNQYNYRIPGIVVSKKGTVLVYWECRDHKKNRKGSTEDECNMDLTVRRSTDGGKSFGEPIFIAYGEAFYQNGYGETLDNPVMIVGDDNRLHFLFCCDVGKRGLFYAYSDDDGLTWTKPRDITEGLRGGIAWDMLAFGPGHGICLQRGEHAGRLIVSAWTWCAKDAYPNAHGSFCLGTRNTTVYSDDNGETWHIGEYASQNRDETSIVELSDGSVMINSRHYSAPYTETKLLPYPEEKARRVVTVSPNGVENWSETVFDPVLIDPACAGNICSVEVKGLPRAILFVNCASTTKRHHLTVRCSFDDAKTWIEKTLYLSSVGWYSDIAVDNRTGRVYVLHENPHVENWFLMCEELFTFSFYDVFAKDYLETQSEE